MKNTFKRSGAALISLVLLLVLAVSAGAASSQNVGVKFWKERSDKESMANSGIDSDRTATLTRQANGTYTLTLPVMQVSKLGVTGYLSGLTIGDVTYDGTLTGDFNKATAVLTIKNLPASVLTGSDVNKSVLVTCTSRWTCRSWVRSTPAPGCVSGTRSKWQAKRQSPRALPFCFSSQVHPALHEIRDHGVQLAHGAFRALGQLACGALDLPLVLCHCHGAHGPQGRACRHAQQNTAGGRLTICVFHVALSFPLCDFLPLWLVFPVKNPVCAFFVPQNVVYCIIR